MNPRFDGADYVPERDDPRLTSQLGRIKSLMLDGEWRTLATIESITGDPPASISAQLRHLRKPRFGAYNVERRHLGGGLYEYRVLEPRTRYRCVVCKSEQGGDPKAEMLGGYALGYCIVCGKDTHWGL